MPDHSHLDKRYFVDRDTYNCPFCNRRNVAYSVTGRARFNWTGAKWCHVYFARCNSCRHTSMHLSYADLATESDQIFPARFDERLDLDEHIFYSVPSSFHVIDDRIPRELRELLAEADGCLKSNFLTGASSCARKVVYELAVREGAEGDDYETRIKSLKIKRPDVDSTYFDTLLTIHQVTSSKVHESAYDGWESKHLKVILSSLKEILHAIYVVPREQEKKRKKILALKEQVLGSKPPKQPSSNS